ncbi:DinB family protein [Streptomyces sp. NBC_00237]|uniref:DinB family protein n=1 Tax=Streptomyces sp. NBC_00237 TaxID=2975687 RepID=UPI00224CDA5D|nr:DinB family protein [Streptomyces sp. NBC_00237]MCX5200547.1 DinB family protein [Streptomyces sp. NBC_00237]
MPDAPDDLTLGLFRRVRRELTAAVEGLDDDALIWRPSPATHSIGWLAWRITRGQDRNLSELMGIPQLWLSDGWADHFHRPADPSDTGLGHTPEQVAAFHAPGSKDLLAYHDVVHTRTERYLTEAPDHDPALTVPSPTLPYSPAAQERLQGLLADFFTHLGQITLLVNLLPDHARTASGTGT